MNLREARWLAEQVVGWLAPASGEIHVAGGIRRAKPDVKDIEIVCRARAGEATDLWGETRTNPLTETIEAHIARGHWRRDEAVPRWGEKYKRLWVPSHAIAVDLFIAEEGNLGNILTLRTGDADFSRALVLKRSAGGLMPKGYFQHQGYLRHLDGRTIPCPTEADYFAALGIDSVPPPETRTADLARRLAEGLTA
jgi:DNA polymerase/3'-5' exonuclease PolX